MTKAALAAVLLAFAVTTAFIFAGHSNVSANPTSVAVSSNNAFSGSKVNVTVVFNDDEKDVTVSAAAGGTNGASATLALVSCVYSFSSDCTPFVADTNSNADTYATANEMASLDADTASESVTFTLSATLSCPNAGGTITITATQNSVALPSQTINCGPPPTPTMTPVPTYAPSCDGYNNNCQCQYNNCQCQYGNCQCEGVYSGCVCQNSLTAGCLCNSLYASSCFCQQTSLTNCNCIDSSFNTNCQCTTSYQTLCPFQVATATPLPTLTPLPTYAPPPAPSNPFATTSNGGQGSVGAVGVSSALTSVGCRGGSLISVALSGAGANTSVPISLTASFGTLTPSSGNGFGGTFYATYTAPPDRAGVATITASAGGLTGSTTVQVTCSSTALAASAPLATGGTLTIKPPNTGDGGLDAFR